MNRITKFVIAAGVIAPALLATSAFAATIPATTIFDGQTQAWGNAGQSITATFRVSIAAGEVVHAIRTKVDSQATICTEIGPFEGAQDVDVPVTVTLPPNSNASGYNLTAELFTTATLPQAEAMTGNLACTGSNTNAYTGTNVLHVLPVSGSNSGSSTGTPAVGSADWMAQLIAALKAALTPATPPVTAPVVSADCSAYAKASAGAVQGVTNSANGRLQGFLIGEGMSIPLLQNNQASYGFYGNQTMAAVGQFQSQYHCN